MSIPPGTALAGKPRRTLEYALVDVFAEAPLEGNMLAIFTDASGLSTDEMQALARETNLAETTFLVPRDAAVEAQHGVQVRIFTVQEELKFAGHPTLGTASWLYWNHPLLRGSEVITLDLPVGPIPVRFGRQDGEKPGVFATMQQNAPVFGKIHDRAAIAAALNLGVDDLDAGLPVQTVSTGMAFCIVPLRSVEVAQKLNIPQHSAQAYLEKSDAKFFFCMAPAAEGSAVQWHNRMQFYNGEDPATGSASGCAIAYLVHYGRAATGEAVLFEQGVEINRPSRIYVQAYSSDEEAPEVEGNSEEVLFRDLVFVGGAPFLLQRDAFSFPDTRDSHSYVGCVTQCS